MCMGGQMSCRRPNQLFGPYVSHPIAETVEDGVTRDKGRKEFSGYNAN